MKTYLLIVALLLGSNSLWAFDNSQLELPLEIHGQQARIIFEKLEEEPLFERSQFSGSNSWGDWTTVAVSDPLRKLRCTKTTDASTDDRNYQCSVKKDLNAILQFLA